MQPMPFSWMRPTEGHGGAPIDVDLRRERVASEVIAVGVIRPGL
jgi:hypothetical protein